MNDVIALWTKAGVRFSVIQGTLELVNCEAALGGPHGWHYRFQSDEGWMLVDLKDTMAFLFASEPKVNVSGADRQAAQRKFEQLMGF
jgi:hypothetical protein